MMRRLDREMIRLSSLIKCEETSKLEQARIDFLMPTYRNLAIKFADLHDTPIRMKAVGAITVPIFCLKGLMAFMCTETVLFENFVSCEIVC